MKKIIIAILAIITLLFPANMFAADHNIEFALEIKPIQDNARTSGRYRETKNPKNPWKVNLKNTTEGKGNGHGNITTFWLEGYDGENVSVSKDVTQGYGAVYTEAKSSASQRKVYLTAQDNRITLTSYNISGVWDEETY